MGMPTLTSSTPAYARAMRGAGLNLHFDSEAGWTEALGRLIDEQRAREQAAAAGRAYAEREYGDERLLAAWDRVFDSL
jgi:hypothetical protein